MKIKLTHIPKLKYFLLMLFVGLLSCEDDIREVYLYKKGVLNATSTNTAIKGGETVTYTDLSTKVRAIKWTFQGGSPGASIEPNVEVKYTKAGTFTTTLEITFVDNTVQKKTFTVEVEAPPTPPIVIPADALKIYSENPDFTKTAPVLNWVSSNQFVIKEVATDGYEGAYRNFSLPATPPATEAKWAMAILQFVNVTDISSYTYINMAVRTTSTGKIRFRMKDASNTGYVEFDATSNLYGLKRDGSWNMVKIPIADYKKQNPALDLTKIKDILVLRSVDPEDVRALNNYTFDFDHIYLSK
ncbi:PKD domain-containing protein [Flavobacterium anhuiense]|uniref:PKD domain-containing protein n=1 Tax=Flavobacterium anhuiense TaxID=459526 RepID=UPI0034D95E0D